MVIVTFQEFLYSIQRIYCNQGDTAQTQMDTTRYVLEVRKIGQDSSLLNPENCKDESSDLEIILLFYFPNFLALFSFFIFLPFSNVETIQLHAALIEKPSTFTAISSPHLNYSRRK